MGRMMMYPHLATDRLQFLITNPHTIIATVHRRPTVSIASRLKKPAIALLLMMSAIIAASPITAAQGEPQQSTQQGGGQGGAQSARRESAELPSIADKTKAMKKLPGYFNLY